MEEKLIARITSWRNESPQTITIQKESEAHFSGKSIATLSPICGDDFDRYHYPLDAVYRYAKLMQSSEEMFQLLKVLYETGTLSMKDARQIRLLVELIENGKIR